MKYRIILALTVFAGCSAGPFASRATVSSSEETPRRGVLVMAHGGGTEWNQAVEATIAPLRGGQPIEIAFGMARPSTMSAAVRALEDQGVEEIAVVRMFISGDSFLERTERILGLRQAVPEPSKAHEAHETHAMPAASDGGHHMEPAKALLSRANFRVSRMGVAESPLVDEILADRVRALSSNPTRESVLILAHGPGNEAENERWLAHMRLRVQRIHDLGPFRHVQVETLREDWVERRKEAERRIRDYVRAGNLDGGSVLVVPFRVAGFGPYRGVLEGLEYVSDGRGFCPHPNMTRWVEKAAERCFAGS